MTKTRRQVEAVLVAVLAAGCSRASDEPGPYESPVLQAYSALLAEAAQCAADVGACASSAQGDAAALQACRADLLACAQVAPEAVAAIAASAATCGLQMRDCVTGDGEPVACKDELLVCLGLGTLPGAFDAGAAPADEPADPKVCLVELQACVAGGEPPAACAESVRACVLSALPPPTAIGGAPAQFPPVASGPAASLPPPAATAISCLQAAHACVTAGTAPDACLAALQSCAGAMP
jgi:hypothetical protein